MQLPPASVLAGWPKPNYVDPVTHGYGNVIMNCVLYAILFTFISLRVFTRTHLRKVFGSDDVFILLAMIPTTAFFVLSVLADTKFLWIRHQYDIPGSHVTTGLKMVLTAQIMFAAACTLTKLSMLMFVKRMLASATIFWRRVTWIAIAIVAIQGSVFCLTVIFQCRPPQDYWKLSVDPQPNCINQASDLLAAGIINTFTDFMVVLLPIRVVWSLQIPTQQQIFVILLFCAGFISCTAGIVRTYYTYRVTTSYDQVWAAYPVWVTSAIELYVGVICASIPATKPFFSTYLPSIFGSLTTTLRGSTPSFNGTYPHFLQSRRSRTHGAPLTSTTTPSSPNQPDPRSPSCSMPRPSFHTVPGEELGDMEKALHLPRSSTTAERHPSNQSMEEENYIWVTQTVELVSAHCSQRGSKQSSLSTN